MSVIGLRRSTILRASSLPDIAVECLALALTFVCYFLLSPKPGFHAILNEEVPYERANMVIGDFEPVRFLGCLYQVRIDR